MANIERVCLNAIIRNLSPKYWYDGYDILAKHTDDLISAAQLVMPDRSIFDEFSVYLTKMVKIKNIELKSAETLDSRFGLFTFNYEPKLRATYYNTFFYASALADNKKKEIGDLDEMIDLVLEVPEFIISQEQKNKILRYGQSVKASSILEEENLETLRKYYALDPKEEKTIKIEVEKEKAYNMLNSMMLKDEGIDLMANYVLKELRTSCNKYRRELYGTPEDTPKTNPEKPR